MKSRTLRTASLTTLLPFVFRVFRVFRGSLPPFPRPQFFSRDWRGYEFCQRGALEHSGRSCRTDGSDVTLRTSWSANQQVGFREMLEKHARSHSPFLRMSTGAKHLHGDRPGYLSACKRLTRFRPPAQPLGNKMNEESKSVERVIGFDAHPDSFTAAILRGATPAAAVTEKLFNQVPIGQLQNWAQKHTTAQDLFVLEASGNSFQVVRTLASLQRRAKVLESCHLGKLKEAHANNDKIRAVRIGKAYLAGTAKEVWVPDAKTQEWRDWFHAHRKAVKRTTQMRARVRSYLSDNGVRLKKNARLTQSGEVEAQIRKGREWSPRQWQVVEILLQELRHADQQRRHRRPRQQAPALPVDRGGPRDPALFQNAAGAVGQETVGAQGPDQSGRGGHGSQAHGGRLVSDDGPLDALGGD